MNDNIIAFKPKPPSEPPQRKPSHPPMINLPPYTKAMIAIIIGVHAVISGISLLFFAPLTSMAIYFGAFIPATFTGGMPFGWWTPLSVLTYGLLHAGWMHVAINSVMLAAAAAGIERTWGGKRMLILFFGSSIIAALTHFAFYPTSEMPIVGASGGISGLFGALIYLMQQMRQGQNMWTIALIWIGVSVVTGMMGTPSGQPVAWLAHVGGFIGGIGMAIQMQRKAP